jgi:hypothetical protein
MKMKQLQEYKISDPNDRYLRQKKLVDESLSQSKIFKDWKISPSDKPANVKYIFSLLLPFWIKPEKLLRTKNSLEVKYLYLNL